MTRSQPMVLIGFADSPATVEVAWSLQEAGMCVLAFTRRGATPALRRLRDIEVHEVEAPEVSIERCLAELTALIERERPDGVMPIDDTSLWLTSCLTFDHSRVIAPSPDVVSLVLDLESQREFATAAGFSVLPGHLMDLIDMVLGHAAPCAIEPSEAVTTVDGRLIRSQPILALSDDECISACADVRLTTAFVLPLMTGWRELVCGYVGESGVTALSAQRSVHRTAAHGPAPSSYASIEVAPELEAATKRLLDELQWQNMFAIELLRGDDGVTWFQRLTGRAWDSMALSRDRGFEYPAWTVQNALGLPRTPQPPATPKQLTGRHLGGEIAQLMLALRPGQAPASADAPGRWSRMREVLRFSRGDRFYNWNRRRPAVLLADTIDTVRVQMIARAKT